MASCLLLLLLPPEIRLHIYDYALMGPEQPVRLRRCPPAQHESKTAILQTCRQIYDEAYPVLLSTNTRVIHPAGEHHTWLFELASQRQKTLRKVVLESDCDCHRMGPRNFHFEMLNTLPSCSRLSLTIRANTWPLVLLWKRDALKYMHGFAKATMDELSDEAGSRQHHEYLPRRLPAHVLAQRNRSWKRILDQLTSACPEVCGMHVGRPASHTNSTVHLSLSSGCFHCEHELGLHERIGMIFQSFLDLLTQNLFGISLSLLVLELWGLKHENQ